MSPWAKRATRQIPPVSSRTQTFDLDDYSGGMDSYTGNDSFPVRNHGTNKWRLAQNARIVTLGEYETRKGVDYLSAVANEGVYFSTTSGTAADKPFDEVTWQAAPVAITGTAVISRVDMYLKNPSNSATGTVLVEIWSDASGPATRLARTSIAASDITSSYSYLPARFVNPPTVTTGTYWVVASVQPSGGNSYNWETGGVTSNAKVTTDSGASWSSGAYGFKIKVYTAFSNLGGVIGIHRAYKSDGTKKTLFVQGTTLYSVDDVTGFLTSIKTGLSASATDYRFITVNDIVYYVNGYDGYRKWDFTTESQVNNTNYSDIKLHKGMVWLKRMDDPTKWEFSNFGVYETFTSTDFFYFPAPKTGDPCESFTSFNGYALVRTQNRAYILSGDDNDTFRLDASPDQKGTYGPNTSTNDKNYEYFLSSDGVYRSNGTQPELISQSIYRDIINIQNKSTACIAVNKGRLYLWYESAGAGYNDSCYVWNLNYRDKGDTVESADTKSYVSRAFSGFADDDTLIVGSSIIGVVYWMERDTNDYCDLGADIDFELQTHYFSGTSPAILKEVRYWQPRFGAQDDNYIISCDYAYDLRNNWQTRQNIDVQGVGSIWGNSAMVWGSFTWGATSETQAQLYIPGEYRRYAIRYKHYHARQPQKFLGMTLRVQERRIR